MRLVTLLICIAPGLAAAGTTSATFDIHVGGIRAGVLSISGEERDGQYAAAGRLQSVGVIGAFRNVQYDAEVRGRVKEAELRPKRYSETYRSGSDSDEKAIVYRNDVPRVRPKDERGRLDPKKQTDTVDPMTAIWGVLRDVGEGEACRFGGDLYDGKRRSRVVLKEPQRSQAAIVCAGEYRRVDGYDDEDMKNPSFPFRLTYQPAGDGLWKVARIEMDTIIGRGTMIRR